MYRAVTFAAMRRGVAGARRPTRSPSSRARSTLEVGEDGVLVDGVDATVEIRGREVTQAVSAVAANSGVRAELVDRQRAWARAARRGVIEGRDIGSVVFPDARLKLYRHRVAHGCAPSGGSPRSAATSTRSRRPSSNVTASTRPAPTARCREADGAIVVDTSEMSIDEVVDQIDRVAEHEPSRLAGSPAVVREPDLRIRSRELIAATITRLCTGCRSTGASTCPVRARSCSPRSTAAYVDTPIACCVTRRRLRFMGKDTLWRNRAFGWLLSALGGFPVTRGTADREALRRCIEVLEDGRSRWCCSPRASARTDRSCSRCSTARPTSPPRRACRSCPSASAVPSG